MKRKLLSLLLALVMVFGLAAPAMAAYEVPSDAKGSIVILHSNDVHGAVEGYAKMAALKAMYEAAGAEVFVMDAGDYIQGTTYVSVSQGATAIELMNLVGYDVAAPGNHEFDYGYENLVELEKAADFPILAANVSYNGGPALGTVTMLTAGDGTKIGVFGLDTPETATKAHPAKIKGVSFLGGEEMYKCAQEQVDALKAEGADVIVCLGHLGIDEETKATANRSIDLLEKVDGIDVLIDGHSHSTEEDIIAATNAERTVNGAVVTSTGTKFANIGVVTIKDGKVVSTDCVSTDEIEVAEDDKVLALAKEIEEEISAEYGAVFARSDVLLNGDKAPGNRTEETNLGDLITDAMLWYATKEDLGVDEDMIVALTNGGGIRAPIAVGDVSKNDVNTVLPFGNTVSVAYVTGSILLEVLEASTYCTPDAIGGFPQMAGIKFTVDTSKAFDQGELYPGTTYYAPASINRVSIQSVNGKDFDPEATYAVVTNDFVTEGGDTYYAMSASEKITNTGTPLDEALIQYITDELDGVITAERYGEPAGRITIKTAKFTDVPDWAVEAVEWAVENNITKGVSETKFDANGECTDQMTLTFIHRSVEADEKNDFYDNAVAWGVEQKLVAEGGTDGTTTRAEAVTYLWKLAGSPEAALADGTFADVEADADYAAAVAWAVENKITNGNGAPDIFDPDGTCNRGQIVTFLQRYAALNTAA